MSNDPVLGRWDAAMDRALVLAAQATGDGDVPVGAVVIGSDGAVLGEGRNTRERDGDPTGHAELTALRRAAAARGSWRLGGTTLVVTLEPCAMCAGAAVLARVDRVVYGADDPKAGACGSVLDVLREPRHNHRPALVRGVRAEQASSQLREFFRDRRVR